MNRSSHAARPSPAATTAPATRGRPCLLAAAATLAMLGCTPALADVINFDSFAPDIYSSGDTLHASGYKLLFLADPTSAANGWSGGVGAILNGGVASSCDILACPSGASGNYLATLNDGGVNFSRGDAQGFRLSGFDYAFIAPVSGMPEMNWGQLQLSGTLRDGSVINTSLNFPGQDASGNYRFQAASLLNGFSNYIFTGLTINACIYNDSNDCVNSLDAPAFNQAQFALDNINISAVPEPSTYLMLLAGLGAIGMLSRRRARSVR